MAINPLSLVAELAGLWQRGSLLLWALAVACFAGFIGAEIVVRVDPTVAVAARTVPLWFLIGVLVFAVLAGFKMYHERTVRTVRLVPNEAQCFCHVATQKDGTRTTQIALRYEAYNLTDQTIWLSEAKVAKPRGARLVHRMVTVQDQQSIYHGRYELPPQTHAEGTAHFIFQGDLSNRITKRGIRVYIADQFAHWHPIRLHNIRVT